MTSESETEQGLLGLVSRETVEAAAQLVPWFAQNMPEYYFRTHSLEEQSRHVRVLLSAQAADSGQTVLLQSPDGGELTFITPGKWIKELLAALARAEESPVSTARIMASRDGRLRISTFLVGPRHGVDAKSGAFRAALRRAAAAGLHGPDERAAFRAFLAAAPADYVDKFEEGRAGRHFRLWQRLQGRERVEASLDSEVEPDVARIMVGMTNPPRTGLLAAMVRVLARRALDIDRAYADVFAVGGERMVFASFYVRCGEECLTAETARWRDIRKDLVLTKWQAPHALERLADERGFGLGRVALLHAAQELAHQLLSRVDPYAYTLDNITAKILEYPDVAARLLDYAEARFDPAFPEGERPSRMAACEEAAREAIGGVAKDVWKRLFTTMLECFRLTLRTNAFREGRLGLAFRLDPELLGEVPEGEEPPYGVYFFHGPACLGFHVRYREMSRGGLRLVPTRGQAQFELESGRLLGEVTALARAQQLKNKDIPEGGSKAVVLLGPGGETDLAVRSVVDALLDLIITDGEGRLLPGVVDHLGRREVIYLGPDENVTPAHIEWIVARARLRGYFSPASFMSSKPGAGINHKVYGVTSLGVVEFLEEALLYLGIDPRRQPFTVKLTGGPRGDVASNAVKLLHRRYGDNARVVAMTDSSGAAHDPAGLDRAELARLILGGLPIAEFDAGKLAGEGAFVAKASDPEGVRLRDELHDTAVADAFIPAGGRPDTISDENWRRFLRPDGTPSARLIVEGANIFISPGARRALEESGVLLIPGPSANKTGVICSSYEVLAGLTLSDEEFLAVKRRYVREVLAILAVRARDEARLLLREHKLSGGRRGVTDISLAASREINALADRIRDCLAAEMPDLASGREGPELARLVLDYCPPVLAERFAERIFERVPPVHRLALLAHSIAARAVYREGLGWLASLMAVRAPDDVVGAYLAQERRVAELAATLRASRLGERERLAGLVEDSGRKLLTLEALGLR